MSEREASPLYVLDVLLGYSQVMTPYDDLRMEDLLDTLAEKRDACGEYDGREDDDEDWPEDVYRDEGGEA